MKRGPFITIGLAVLLAFLAASLAMAQQSVSATKKTALTASPAISTAASTECGEHCADSASRFDAPDQGGARDYECAGDNCSCAGAADCVAMKKICAPGTLTCNDYGCTCAQAPEPDGNGG